MSAYLWSQLFMNTSTWALHRGPSVISQEKRKKEQECVCTHTWRGGGEEWEEKEEGEESMKVRYLYP